MTYCFSAMCVCFAGVGFAGYCIVNHCIAQSWVKACAWSVVALGLAWIAAGVIMEFYMQSHGISCGAGVEGSLGLVRP